MVNTVDIDPSMEQEPTQEPAVLTLDQIDLEEVLWLWPGRLPAAKVVVIEGEPESGKTSLVLDVAARLTTGGPMPDLDESEPATYGALGEVADLAKLADLKPRSILFMSAEDGAGDTIKPRFLAAGGDPTRFLVQQPIDLYDRNGEPIGKGLPPLPSEAHHIAAEVKKHGVSLAIIDGLGSFLDRGISLNNGPDVRRVIGSLASIAAETGCTIVIIRHFNKSASGNAMNRGGGSIDITAQARVVLQVTRHPNDDNERVLTVMKSNLTKKPPSLTYRIDSTTVKTIAAPKIRWTGTTDLTADALAAHSFHKATNPDNPTKVDEARQFILETLGEGPLLANDLLDLARSQRHSARTFERARAALKSARKIKSERDSDGHTVWSMAE